MDPRLLKYYNRELAFMREMGAEFAQEFPKIAARLSLEGFDCADPYVERLLEGFAFLAARVQLKIDSEYPRFTQHLLETVYPHYLSPMPSMVVVQLKPDPAESALAEGFTLARGSALRSRLGKGEQTACEYRTAHDVTLWPIEVQEATYLPSAGDLAAIGVTDLRGARAGLRLRIGATAGLTIDQLSLDRIPFFLRGTKQTPARLYEQLVACVAGVVVRPAARPTPWQHLLDRSSVRPLGFSAAEAMLPSGPRSFSGYRLLAEYFACPSRFLFVEIGGLAASVRRCTDTAMEVVVLLNRGDPELDRAVDASEFALHCTPAINLFPKRADRIHVNERETEFHVVPDRTRPMDFEVFGVTGVTGFGAGFEQSFRPLYSSDDFTHTTEGQAYYAIQRLPRVLSAKQRQVGPRSTYIGSELYLSLVDTNEAPYRSDLRQLGIDTLCTNRDLPLFMPVGAGGSDFNLESGAPVESVRCVSGPMRPRPPYPVGESHWRLINHLALNYLSLADTDGRQGAAALRDLLGLYGDTAEAIVRKQVEGISSIASRPINRRLPSPGPITFGRGLEITVTCDEAAFEGTGVLLLGAVIEQFFARYVSLNSFTETVLRSTDRGEIMRWPARIGRRQIL